MEPDRTPKDLKLIKAIAYSAGEPAFYLFSGTGKWQALLIFLLGLNEFSLSGSRSPFGPLDMENIIDKSFFGINSYIHNPLFIRFAC